MNNQINKKKLFDLLIKFRKVFSGDLKDLKTIPYTNFVIETATSVGTIKAPFKLPEITINKMRKIFDEMFQAGIKSKDKSENSQALIFKQKGGKAGTWSSAAFIINQKGSERFIVDYRDENSKTKNLYIH